ncbi:MAG: sensor histidine kinase [Saprospiraceae bacterium]|nr:sensor histidine kinase [Saprospiraceae bacterium]
MNDLLANIKRLLTRRTIYHAAFWFVLLCVLTLSEMQGGDASFMHFFTNELVNVLFYAAIYYINSEFLIPKYLKPNKLIHYLVGLVGTALVLTPIKVFIFFQKFQHFPEDQDFLISHQSYYYLISLMTAGISTIVKISSDWVRNTQTQRDLETRTMQTELNFLKSQINPHFLFNTLNSLYALTLKKSDEAPEVVIKLSEMMRYMLYECNEAQVPLSKEVNYIRNYLDLERLRHKNMDIKFDVEGSIGDLTVAPLIFIAFIENAFKHGASNHISPGFVHIHIYLEGGELNLYVENSKPEKQPSQDHRRSGGIGLVNVKRRLDILYKSNHHLEVYDKPNTYAVNLWLKLLANGVLSEPII